MSFLAAHRHKHDWTRWEVTARLEIRAGHAPIVVMFTGKQEWHVVGEMRRQERECKSCGLSQVKTEKVYF
jgi:hypothetical protein